MFKLIAGVGAVVLASVVGTAAHADYVSSDGYNDNLYTSQNGAQIVTSEPLGPGTYYLAEDAPPVVYVQPPVQQVYYQPATVYYDEPVYPAWGYSSLSLGFSSGGGRHYSGGHGGNWHGGGHGGGGRHH